MPTQKVCSDCFLGNLTENVNIVKCGKCYTIYCIHFASAVDPQFCIECFGDISVTKEIVTKTYEHYNEETDELTTYKRKARSIELRGNDWLFSQRRISSMSDAETELAIEYHRAILILLVNERESRRNAKMHRYAGMKIQIVKPTEGVSTTTTTTKTKELKSSKVAATAAATIAELLKQGKSAADLMQMLQQLQAQLGAKP